VLPQTGFVLVVRCLRAAGDPDAASRHVEMYCARRKWIQLISLVHEFDRLPRSGSTAYGFVVGIYPIADYPVLPEPEP
jgi:hypothetical protein